MKAAAAKEEGRTEGRKGAREGRKPRKGKESLQRRGQEFGAAGA